MKYIDITNAIDIPSAVAHCPECFGELWVEVTEWEPATGEITEGGFELNCSEEISDPDSHSERWVSDWHPVENKVYQWLLDNVRVAQATESHLRAWNVALQDWAR